MISRGGWLGALGRRVNQRRECTQVTPHRGVFDLDSRDGVRLTVTRVTAAGPPAGEVADALAGRSLVAVVLGDLPASSRSALSLMADFFNSPVGQSPA